MTNKTKWAKIELATGDILYTNSSMTEQYPVVVGPGDRDPHPQEVVDALKNKTVDYISHFASGVGIKSRPIESSQDNTLPNGAYRYFPGTWTVPPGLIEMQVRDEATIDRKIYKEIEKDITQFIAAQDTYEKAGVFFKRGLLMYGSPGEGKTCIIRQLIDKAFPEDAIPILIDGVPAQSLATHLNAVEPDRLKVYIIEEIASMIFSPMHSMRDTLDFLDGHSSPENTLFIATTNYPEILPGNLIERPSRFDILVEVKSPDKDEITDLVKLYLSKTPSADEVKQLHGLSTAAIKEVCMMARLHKKNIELAALRFKKRQKAVQQWRSKHNYTYSPKDLFIGAKYNDSEQMQREAATQASGPRTRRL